MSGRVILAIALLGFGAAAYFTVDTVMGNRTAEAQAIAKKKQAEADAKRSAARKAADEKKKAEADAEAAKLKLAEKKEEAARAKADVEAQKIHAEAEKAALARAKAERGVAADARVKAEAEESAAKAKKAEAEANRAAAEAKEKETAEARLVAEAALAREKIAAERQADALKAEELKKANYDKLVEEAAELKAIWEQRERESRPAKTVKDLIAESEAARQEEAESGEGPALEVSEGDAAVAAVDAPPTKKHRPEPPKSAGDLRIEKVDARIAADISAAQGRTDAVIARRYERRIRECMSAGDADGAQRWLDALVSLLPHYDVTNALNGVATKQEAEAK